MGTQDEFTDCQGLGAPGLQAQDRPDPPAVGDAEGWARSPTTTQDPSFA